MHPGTQDSASLRTLPFSGLIQQMTNSLFFLFPRTYLHKSSKKQEDTSDSQPDSDDRHQPIQKATQDQILLLAFLR